jgi:hypothetical protein
MNVSSLSLSFPAPIGSSLAGKIAWKQATPNSVAVLYGWLTVASSKDGSVLAAGGNCGRDYETCAGVSIFRDGSWADESGLPYYGTYWPAIAISSDNSYIFASNVNVYEGTGLQRSINKGYTWNPLLNVPPNFEVDSLASSGDGQKLVAGDSRTAGVFTSSNGGNDWVFKEFDGIVRAVASSADGKKLVAVGDENVGVWTSSDFGATWSKQNGLPTRSTWLSVASSSDGSKLAAGEDGGHLWLSSNSGATWVQVS